MKERLIAMVFLVLAAACETDDLETPGREPVRPVEFDGRICPSVSEQPAGDEERPFAASRALIDEQTTRNIRSQFLRVDEVVGKDNLGTYEFRSWDEGYLMNASIISSPGNETQDYLRSVVLNPVQSYKLTVDGNDSLFYHTRMVSWYPITCHLHEEDGVAAVTKLNYFTMENVGFDAYEVMPDGSVQINFFDLDGTKDVMVSDVREAQYWHHPTDPGNNPSDVHNGESVYRQPFGVNETNPSYNNTFRYKHYMSAVKVYAYTDESDQNASMWGRILKVVVRKQPSRCSVTLPRPTFPHTPGVQHDADRIYGEAVFGNEHLTNFDLTKSPIFGDDTNGEGGEVAPDSPSLEGTSKENKVYLGYSLIQPDADVLLDVHTESGVYSVKVSRFYDRVLPDGKVERISLFRPGYIYRVALNFSTSGTISEIILDDSDGVFYDLSRGMTFVHGVEDYVYKTANSYIVDPTQKDPETGKYYDGYVFLGNVIGNGDEGLLPEFPNKTTRIKPASAALLWESEQGLISQVDYRYNYVRFKVPHPDDNGAFKKGNAVVGVFDNARKLQWTWHIWVTDRPQDVAFPLNGKDVVIMDRNLGATASYLVKSDDVVDTYGLYYQWGRKDPSMPPPTANYRPMSTACRTFYDYFGRDHHNTSVVMKDKPTVEDAIRNPSALILPSAIPPYYSYDWLYNRINTLWGSYENNDLKTIYDPCPFGYKVPGEALNSFLFSNFSKSRRDDNVNAYVYTMKDMRGGDVEVSFPLAGYKGVDHGMSSLTAAWKYVGEKGDYMSKTVNRNGHRGRLYLSRSGSWKETGADNEDEDGFSNQEHIYKGNIFTDAANRRTAASVRCVADKYKTNPGYLESYIYARMCVMLGHGRTLTGGAVAKIHNIREMRVTQSRGGHFMVDSTFMVGKLKYERTLNLPGYGTPDAYDKIGTYVYSVTATSDVGLEHVTIQPVKVVNVTEIYDAKFGDMPVEGNSFELGTNAMFSFRINMMEPGQTGRDNTTPEYLKLLASGVIIKVNGVEVKYDETERIFRTQEEIPVNGKVKVVFLYDNEELKRFENRIDCYCSVSGPAVTKMERDMYYVISTTDGSKWWMYNPNANKAVVVARSDKFDVNYIFRAKGANGQSTWLEAVAVEKLIGENFTANNSEFDFLYTFGGTNKNEVGLYKKEWWWNVPLVLQRNNNLSWGNSGGKPTYWHFYKVKIRYSPFQEVK